MQHPHNKKQDEPDESADEEEREAKKRDLPRNPLVLHAEVALGHRRGVVAEAHHDRPADDVASAVAGREGEGGRFCGQFCHEIREFFDFREGGEEHDERERHQDRGLDEVGDDDGL
jgi:hypothetical protein